MAGHYSFLRMPGSKCFVSNKFMSSYVICLVIAKEIFHFQSDCSPITKVHNIFRYWAFFIVNLFCKRQRNVKNRGHFIQIGYFPTQNNYFRWSFPTWMSVFMSDFSTNPSGSIVWETSSPLLLLVWKARTKLNSKKNWKVFHHCHPFLGT